MANKHRYWYKISLFLSKGIVVSLFLSLVPFLVIVLLKPIDFQEYQISFEKKIPRTSEHINWYEDIDGDGKEEYMNIYNHKLASLALQITNANGKQLGQFNLASFMPKTMVFLAPFFVDLNKDKVKEILFFSQNKDSIFLNIFDYKKLDFILTKRFIVKIGLSKNCKLDYLIKWIEAKDINNDGVKEIYFIISTGFGLYPRNVFRYDFVNDSLISSPNIGAKIVIFQFKDSVLFVGSHASDNCKKGFPYPYTDTCTWLFGFNEDLKYVFDPIPFIGKPASIISIAETDAGVAFSYFNQGINGTPSSLIYIKPNGKITRRIKMEASYINKLKINEEIRCILLNRTSGKTNYFDIEKGIMGQEITQLKYCFYKSSKDIDHDGEIEHVFYDNNYHRLVIAQNDLQTNITLDFNLKKESFRAISSGIKDGFVELIIHTDYNVLKYRYFKNPNYRYKYLFWFVVYLLSFIFISTILTSLRKV